MQTGPLNNVGQPRIGFRMRVMLALIASLAITPITLAAVSCSISTSGIAFGNYNPLSGTPTDSTSTVSVTCTLTSPADENFSYTLKMSTGSSGSYLSRTMASGGNQLSYNLYVDFARQNVWGDGSGTTTFNSGSMSLGHGLGKNGSETDNFTSYGRISAAQDVAAGSYNDSIIVTLTF